MSGNYMVETKVSASLSTNYQQAGLMIRQDANNWAKTCFEYSDGLTVKTVVNRNNAANVEQVTSVPTGATVVWLRLVRNGDSYTAYYSFDGSMWTQQYSWSQPLQGTLMVGLSVTDGNSGVAFQPSFEYFRYSNLASSSYSIQGGGSTFPCSILSNSQVSSLTFDQASKQIGFSVTGDAGTSGVCNVTIPTQLLGGTFTVLIDGSPHPATVTSDATHTSIFFTYSHSTHQVQVIGTSVVPEFPTMAANVLVLAVLALVLLLAKSHSGRGFG
jgi:regulation of enolase protein 1 (concanavalin A-like superfamily)